jgi:hypothetical protein
MSESHGGADRQTSASIRMSKYFSKGLEKERYILGRRLIFSIHHSTKDVEYTHSETRNLVLVENLVIGREVQSTKVQKAEQAWCKYLGHLVCWGASSKKCHARGAIRFHVPRHGMAASKQ